MEQKYNVFISYRRDGGEFTAKTIHDKLHDLGYQVFLDVESLRSGLFNVKLYSVIDECTDVVIILSPGALDRCENEDDWVRREIEYALQKGKNVIPIMLRGFDFPEKLPVSMETLPYMQGLQANLEYFAAFIQKLQSFLLAEPYHPNLMLPKKILTFFIPVALTALVVTIGIAFIINNRVYTDQTSSPNPDWESSQTAILSGGSDTVDSSTGEIAESVETEDDIRWQSNTLMMDVTRDVNQHTGVLGSDIERNKIHSITFLDSLDSMPENAWDVSEKQNKKVMAWTNESALYIGGEGGVAANENCYYLFAQYINLECVQMNGNFHTDNARNMRQMFYNCPYLTQLDLSNFDTSNVTDMRGMFTYCYSLTQLDLSNFDTSNVTYMDNMFTCCENLTQLDLSNFDTSNVTDISGMFLRCESLTQLDVSNFDTSSVTDMSFMFSNCMNLTQLDLSNFDTSSVTDMNCMFSKCVRLTQLDLSNFNTSNVNSMLQMFKNCSSLTQLDLSNFDTSNVTSMAEMFDGCSSLTQLDVSNFDTSNVVYATDMFSGCDKLTRPNVSNFAPELVENMGLSR